MKNNKKLWVATLLLLVVVALAACGGAQQAAEQAEIAAPGDSLVSGTVTYLDRSALPAGAIITVELADVSIADAPANVLATQTIPVGDQQAPFPFELAYDPTAVNPASRYVVQ
ncbi:MAG TPA: YbaY family lipoprotein, partial [Promineifilum sp.]|nr:YbaY family lipoprotein [Promineifilum sp.]